MKKGKSERLLKVSVDYPYRGHCQLSSAENITECADKLKSLFWNVFLMKHNLNANNLSQEIAVNYEHIIPQNELTNRIAEF